MLLEIRRFVHDRAAIVGPIMALSALPIFGMVGVAIDHGRVSRGTADAYNIVQEACARISSTYFASQPASDRVAAATDVMDRRSAAEPELSDVSFAAADIGGPVIVPASGTLQSTLAGLAGIDTMTIDVQLVCGDRPAAAAPTTAPVCVNLLSPRIKRSLHVHESEISALGCELHVRSDHGEAAVIHKKSTVRTARLCVAGQIINGPFIESDPLAPTDEFIDDGTSTIAGTAMSTCLTAPDIYVSVLAPPIGACTFNNFVASAPTVNLRPGVYCGGIEIKANVRARFRPGIYQIVDGPLTAATGARLEGTEVALVLQGSGSDVTLEGAVMNLTAPTSGSMAGHVLFQAFGEPAVKVTLSKGSQAALAGNLYLGSGDLKINSSTLGPIIGEPLTIHSQKLDVNKSQVTVAAN